MANPLDGVRVVTFEQAVAAPLCTRHLADLGARVVKVENPRGGDFTRAYDTAVNGLASTFVWLNRNKESLTLDVKHPSAQPVLDRLLGRADVVVQNLAPGAAARIGVDDATLTARLPRVVAVDMSGYGTGGPLAHKRAYDLLVQCEAGSCAITGRPGEWAKPGIPFADVGSGVYAFSSILAALLARAQTGQGTAISVSMFDTIAEWMGFALNYTSYTGLEREPNGLSSPTVAPYGAYPTGDGQTVVLGTTNDQEWQRFALQLLDRPDLAADERYATNADRCARRAELDPVIAAWTANHPLDELRARADAAGIGNARLNSVPDVIAHRQLVERDRWRDVESEVGPLRALLPPFESPDWKPRMDGVPALGQHTQPVLRDLGFTTAEIAELRRSGAL
jgi:crotonobetainyl-CoA:carnitine CoA-transferase CaiB-like acyl-CoA transferase